MPAATKPAPTEAVCFPPEEDPEARQALESLAARLRLVADRRAPKGKVHDLHAVLCLVVVAMLCGQFGLARAVAFAMSQGARRRFSGPRARERRIAQGRLLEDARPAAWLAQIGLLWRGVPTVPEAQTIGRLLDLVRPSDLKEAIEGWLVDAVEAARRRAAVVSVDGKKMRGAGSHVLSAFVHDLGVTFWHLEVGEKKNELSALRDNLAALIARFPALWLLVGDAVFADRTLCALLKDSGREWFFTIKDNQPNLREKLEGLFSPQLCAGGSEVTDGPEKRGPMWRPPSTTPSGGTHAASSACPT